MALMNSRQLIQEYEDEQHLIWELDQEAIVEGFMRTTGLGNLLYDEYGLLWFVLRELELDWDRAMLIVTDKEWH